MTEHPSLDDLAAHAAGEAVDVPGAGALDPVAVHVATCAECSAGVTALRATTAQLASLPPVRMPDAVAAALDAALAAEAVATASSWSQPETPGTAVAVDPPTPPLGGNVTILPTPAERAARKERSADGPSRWVQGGAAASVVLLVGVLAFTTLRSGNGDEGKDGNVTAAGSADSRGLLASGQTYSKDGLKDTVRGVLAGTLAAPPAAADTSRKADAAPTNEAFTSPGEVSAGTMAMQVPEPGVLPAELVGFADKVTLQQCVDAVAAEKGRVPVLVDAASYEGEPALVLVLDFGRPDSLDVFVVGSRCNAKDADFRYFERVPRP